jgi:hypothetical protein
VAPLVPKHPVVCAWCAPTDDIRQLANRCSAPPLWDFAKFGFGEGIREQVVEGLGEAGIAAFGFRADGVEVDEPGFEEGPRDRLQRFVHSSVQLEFVVQCTEDTGNGTLFVGRGQDNRQIKLSRDSEVRTG